ncbi:MAG: hypothetical protein AB1295_05945 [Candidatus Micrarchaeota archaeon]
MSVHKTSGPSEMAKIARHRRIIPRGFPSERLLIDNIALGCRGEKILMLTGNYTVRAAPDMEEDDSRLLGPEMLLTIDLCVRVFRRCQELGIKPPSLVLLPNDIAPGAFPDFREGQRFKAGYSVPESIQYLLRGLYLEPIFLFNRDFELSPNEVRVRMEGLRRKISEGYEKLIIIFESYAQNLAAKMLSRRQLFKPGELMTAPDKSRRLLLPMRFTDNGTVTSMHSTVQVSITNPNGAPYCSFLAATLFHEFEKMGYTKAVNTFVTYEYPCVDKAAAAYRCIYGGKIPIRNLYLEGNEVIFDNTI